MSSSYRKERPSGDFAVSLLPASVRRSSVPRLPEVTQTIPGRRGREVANEIREKLFREWWQMIIDQLAEDSVVIVVKHGQRVIADAINEMLDLYLGTEGHPTANAVMEEVTRMCIQDVVAGVRAIIETHLRRMGEII